MTAADLPALIHLHGVVERLTFHADDTGYTVARLNVTREPELITIVGTFAHIEPGQTLKLFGFWREHPKYGSQFQVKHYQETKPATLTGIEKYLGSGLIKGVGPVTARRIVNHFGLETLDVIEQDIQRLIEVPGIARKRIELIQAAWVEQQAIKEVMLFLQGHGVSTTYAVKIYKTYGNDAIAVVTHNPYRLATDVYGIGFVTADAIARNLGIAPNSEFRYRAGLVHVLSEAADQGHCYLPKAELVQTAMKRLTIEDHQPHPEVLDPLIEQMATEQELILHHHDEQACCYKPAFYVAEQHLAQQVQLLLSHPVAVDVARVQRWIQRVIDTTGLPLSLEQQQAVEMAASHRVLILTGGPGCGKTFTTRTIVALWQAMGKRLLLAAPTGRAAQRLSEMTGKEAKTIHRLLEFDPSHLSFQRHEANPLDTDAVVIDEASMLDLFLANALLKAIPAQAHLLLVGDIDQLPSVGPGNVLRDLIDSGCIPVVRLTQVFRQAQASQIVVNAHRINHGDFPQLESVSPRPRSDCLWLGAPEPEPGIQGMKDLIQELIPTLGFNPVRDVQVLCPSRRGTMGTRNLNQVLQTWLNPAHPQTAELNRGSQILRVGDRVLQQVNDYERDVFNGDLGTVVEIDAEEQAVKVQYDQRWVTYDAADLNELTLAWAVTIHKSQGSEYPVVILPLFTQHYLMLTRNLLYTGLTRAKQLAIIVGPKKAVAISVGQVRDRQRYTLLDWRINANISEYQL
ncbi:MAG: SF1B family DNA helicase RecD2 [Thainema sp.]